MARSSRIAPARQVVTRPHEQGGLIAIHMETGICWEMNRTGRELWERLARATTVDELLAAQVRRYGECSGRIEREALTWVQDLVRAGLIALDDGDADPPPGGPDGHRPHP
jgi:hypothetical protein